MRRILQIMSVTEDYQIEVRTASHISKKLTKDRDELMSRDQFVSQSPRQRVIRKKAGHA